MESRVDASRFNRKERRRLGKMAGVKIPGRNLPYVESVHGSYENYLKIREDEIKQDYAGR